MHGEHWIVIAISRQIFYFAHSLGCGKYSYLKQQCEKLMPEPLQSHPRVCGFYTIYKRFTSSNSDKKKLQEFTMLWYFLS